MQVFDKDTYLCVGKVADFEAIGKVFCFISVSIKMKFYKNK